jgi:hypothetical protein
MPNLLPVGVIVNCSACLIVEAVSYFKLGVAIAKQSLTFGLA